MKKIFFTHYNEDEVKEKIKLLKEWINCATEVQ